MAVCLGILSGILLLLYCRQRVINRNLNNEVLYVRERLGVLTDVSYTKENGYILIPSENVQVKELAAQLNRLLEIFYLQKADWQRERQVMDQVLTNISHDLRTPLTVLKGYSELLKKETRKETGTPALQEMAARIDQKADELVGTINEYFIMAKIESGDMKIEPQGINITQVCNEIMLDYYDILEEAQYEVDIQTGGMPVFVCADAVALERILKNLIDNAVRHGGSGKYLGIRLKSHEGKVTVEIEDHGPGISAEEREQIFSRNYTTARRGAGSGLGLTIARSLAQQMGADISVDSEPGIRTIFYLKQMLEKG